jgi:hypothetical protein
MKRRKSIEQKLFKNYSKIIQILFNYLFNKLKAVKTGSHYNNF